MVTRTRSGSSDGPSVDLEGTPVIDPTKNVLDLVRAESRYQDGMREASERLSALGTTIRAEFGEIVRRLDEKFQDARFTAETRRIDQLAQLRQVYETRIADMLSASVQSTSSLVSTQLVQIQATFDARVSKLEQFRWESGGRSSVADPALAEALSQMAAGISAQKDAQSTTSGRSAGSSETTKTLVAWLVAAVAVAGLGFNYMGKPVAPAHDVATAPPGFVLGYVPVPTPTAPPR